MGLSSISMQIENDANNQDEDDEKKYDENENIINGAEQFMKDILSDIDKMEQMSVEHGLTKAELWNTRFCHVGNIFHFVKEDSVNAEAKHDTWELVMGNENGECTKRICNCIWQTICNVLRCRLCLDHDDTRYCIYRADPTAFCDKLLISPHMLSDHMPQSYLTILQNAVKNQS